MHSQCLKHIQGNCIRMSLSRPLDLNCHISGEPSRYTDHILPAYGFKTLRIRDLVRDFAVYGW